MAREIRLGGRRIRLPRNHRVRISLGVGLVVGGVLGFLPVLGFWMVPLGILVLSHDIPAIRRFRRRVQVWWERRRRPAPANGPDGRTRDQGGEPEARGPRLSD
jgi:hypothetical protein